MSAMRPCCTACGKACRLARGKPYRKPFCKAYRNGGYKASAA